MKDKVTVTLGITYVVIIAIMWILLFLPYTYDYYQPMSTPYILYAGVIIAIACIFLIPSVIFYLKFVASDSGEFTARAGFYFGVISWIVGIVGHIFLLLTDYVIVGYYESCIYLPILITACFIVLAMVGTLIFFRRYKWEELLGPTCPICSGTTQLSSKKGQFYCKRCKKYF